ncbi:hypothetical protein SCP_0108910 [Sparassis crispa]|uniref:Uncharacterized protein n=1 Tax=Sparassis crispa TaxID=139825 RepID=A0A401G784_9APHY|nr:hypothetical protein SCP_0108910 [Sparassis crispa]GBE78009.1 hypothetical protein SCP_0108910 [Sparassis crispa]
MFALKTILLALVFSFAAHVIAYPMPMPLRRTLANRLAPMEVIPAYIKRADVNTNIIPAEVPTMAPQGVIEEYSNQKRADFHVTRDDISARIAIKHSLHERADLNVIPAEVPTMAPASVLEEYHNKRQILNTIPAEVPTMSPTGVLEEFFNGPA